VGSTALGSVPSANTPLSSLKLWRVYSGRGVATARNRFYRKFSVDVDSSGVPHERWRTPRVVYPTRRDLLMFSLSSYPISRNSYVFSPGLSQTGLGSAHCCSAEMRSVGSAAEDAYGRCVWSRASCTTTCTVTAPVD